MTGNGLLRMAGGGAQDDRERFPFLCTREAGERDSSTSLHFAQNDRGGRLRMTEGGALDDSVAGW